MRSASGRSSIIPTAATPYPSTHSSTPSSTSHLHAHAHVSATPTLVPLSYSREPPSTREEVADADILDSKARNAASIVKARAQHTRFASLGRIRSRASIQQEAQQPAPTPAAKAPLSPSDAGSRKRSDTSTSSKTSSETSLSDDVKSSPKSADDRLDRPSFLLASNNLPSDITKDHEGHYERRGQPQRPRLMHQTSSKLLRMTDDERPFTRDFQWSRTRPKSMLLLHHHQAQDEILKRLLKDVEPGQRLEKTVYLPVKQQDFKDLFSTLMVSLPLTPHRVRFTRVEHTFTTEEAMTNLGSLKFSQSNRMPDPKDPSRIVTTTTTTTFSMAKEMARSVCQRFLDARFIESVDGKSDFTSKSSVWQLTPKGMHILARFCQRNGIYQRHVNDLLDSPRNMMQLVILERDSESDKLSSDAAMINVIFRRFAGDVGPNVKLNPGESENGSLSDYATGLVGVKMQRGRRGERDAPYLFTGKAAFDWLMDCCTLVDKREVFELANLFLQHGLIETASDQQNPNAPTSRFVASKNTLYTVTTKGQRIAGWVTSPNGSVNGDATVQSRVPNGVSRDSNTNRMTLIVRDPALRLLFREYLRETHCEENLAFYVEVSHFLGDYQIAKRKTPAPKMDAIRETLASAYSLYNAFLAPGSPCELNIDHSLRNALANRMTKAIGDEEQMVKSLDDVADLFEKAQASVFKLMASDSVPKFSREPKYATMLRDRNLEGMLAAASIG